MAKDLLTLTFKAMTTRRIYNRPRPTQFRLFPPGAKETDRAGTRPLQILKDNGWRPHRALQLCQSYDPILLNSLASLVRDAGQTENHRQCLDIQRCCSHDLAQSCDYPFRHDCDQAHTCTFVQAPRNKLKEILQSGEIPVLSISRKDGLDLQVIKWSPWLAYTAISHVWSDGLGNPRANALPECQLLRLRKLISESYLLESSPLYDASTIGSQFRSSLTASSGRTIRQNNSYSKPDKKRLFFWIDTLCIPAPIESESADVFTDLRLRAIRSISPTFAGSYNTVILNQGLLDANIRNHAHVSADEFTTLKISSKWIQRGWTLEEGSLLAVSQFQINSKSYETVSTLANLLLIHEENATPLARVSVDVRSLLPRLLLDAVLDDKKHVSIRASSSKGSHSERSIRAPLFVWIWNSLLERSTTRPQDGPIILANLLDFNTYRLKSVAENDRLKVIIQSCNEIPFPLLYNVRSQSETNSEFAWIPQNIEGDHIHTGATLLRIKSTETDGHQVKFLVDRSNTTTHDFLVMGLQSIIRYFGNMQSLRSL